MISWPQYFLRIASEVATRSKDESTNIGCVVVGKDNQILSTGYNSFPRGANDNIEDRQQRPLKYHYFVHAEENAICQAARHGISLRGSTFYILSPPCPRCARSIIQVGARKIIYPKSLSGILLSKEEEEATLSLLDECEVEVFPFKKDCYTTTLIRGEQHEF